MKFIQMLPAVDWFVVWHRQANHAEPISVMRVAIWALDAEGDVVGMVPSSTHDGREQAMLEPAAGAQTKYKHLGELSEKELAMFREGQRLRNSQSEHK